MNSIEEYQPSTLYDILRLTYEEKTKNNDTYANNLIKIIKKYHLWPLMQVKKFKENENIVLLHNSYNRNDIDEQYKELYFQCRSVVLDFENVLNHTVVVSYANNIPIRVNIDEFSNNINTTDIYQEAYDGTTVTVYNYKDKWYFGTSTCTNINNSKYLHPTKSHGEMLNEILMYNYRNHFSDEEINNGNLQAIEQKLRDIFTSYLDKTCAYEFVLLHHENVHLVDYSDIYGNGYKKLIHINTKHRETQQEFDISNMPFISYGIIYPQFFQTYNDACLYIINTKSYGFIVKQTIENGFKKLYKISPKNIEFLENTNPRKMNVWHNILTVYMKNNKEFKIKDYINMYVDNLELPKDEKGRDIDPTYLIHTMISTLRDIIYNLYISTTAYNTKANYFKMNKELDLQLPPIIRFHLAQLRHRQLTCHKNHMITQKDIFYYLCKCNDIKNIKMLVSYFSCSNTCNIYNITDRSVMCFVILNNLL